jgi:hypothetical protein
MLVSCLAYSSALIMEMKTFSEMLVSCLAYSSALIMELKTFSEMLVSCLAYSSVLMMELTTIRNAGFLLGLFFGPDQGVENFLRNAG